MRTTPLHADFGVEVHGVDLARVTAESGYHETRNAFERHSLLLFRGQTLSDAQQLAFARLFGPLEDRESREVPEMAPVSNLDEAGKPFAADDIRTRDLMGNQLWHTDSTFLPVPALANVIQARQVSSRGGETELVSTRAGLKRLAPDLQARLAEAVFVHRLTHSRAKIDAELAAAPWITRFAPQHWRAIWPNPVTGEDALYIASHASKVVGMDPEAGLALLDELMAEMTVPEAIYTHRWRIGDVLVWDERATLHRGRPWPYEEPRVLASICVSAGAADGLGAVRAR